MKASEFQYDATTGKATVLTDQNQTTVDCSDGAVSVFRVQTPRNGADGGPS